MACHSVLARYGARDRYTYYRCTGCGTLQLVPMPTREELSEAYRDRYATAGHCRTRGEDEAGVAQPYYDALLDTLRAHRVSGRVLEVGSGWGGLAETLLRAGFDYRGIDVSEEMVAACKERGLPIAFKDIADEMETGNGAIVMSAVFEHLIEHDAWLDHAARLLRPGGLFISMQPTAHFARFVGGPLARVTGRLPQLHQVFCPPWHTVLFSIAGMTALLRRHGFEPVEVRRGPHARGHGLGGIAQRALETVNRVGWNVLGTRWPLVISHIFVFRRLS